MRTTSPTRAEFSSSCGGRTLPISARLHHALVRLGCALRISISTTIVFRILVETTRPTFSLRREACASGVAAVFAAAVLVVSAIVYTFFAFLRVVRVLAASSGGLGCGRCGFCQPQSARSREIWSGCGRYRSFSTRASFLDALVVAQAFREAQPELICSADFVPAGSWSSSSVKVADLHRISIIFLLLFRC